MDDASVDVHSRLLLVTGKPGAGKTEAVVGAATEGASKGERVAADNADACEVASQGLVGRREDEAFAPARRVS